MSSPSNRTTDFERPLPATMEALVMRGTGLENVAVREVPVPRPGPDQLLARVDAAGVCTSLLKIIQQGAAHTYFHGWDPAKYPVILGDEGSLTLVRVGEHLRQDFQVGQRLVVQPSVESPPINFRERYDRHGEDMPKTGVGYTLGGNLAQYLLIQEEVLVSQSLIPLPDGRIPYFAASMAEPISCVVSAHEAHVHTTRAGPFAPRQPKLGILENGVTLLVGAGAMGRIHAELILRFRPGHLIVCDPVQSRLDWVKHVMGPKAQLAGVQLHLALPDRVESILARASQGRGADDVIVAVGVRTVQQKALEWPARDGIVNLFGGLKKGDSILELDAIRVHYDGTRVVGTSGGFPADIATTLDLILAGAIDPGNHLGLVGSLDQAVEAIRLIEAGKAEGKTVLYPHLPPTPLRPAENWTLEEEDRFLREHNLNRYAG